MAGLSLRNRCSAQVIGRSGRTGPCGLYRHLDNSIKLGYPAAKGHIEIVPKRVYNCRNRREHVENKLTLRQAAKLTGCSEAHLWRLARSGGTFEAEMLGYNWAIDRDSLLAFVREQERSGGWHGPHGPHGQGPSFFSLVTHLWYERGERRRSGTPGLRDRAGTGHPESAHLRRELRPGLER